MDVDQVLDLIHRRGLAAAEIEIWVKCRSCGDVLARDVSLGHGIHANRAAARLATPVTGVALGVERLERYGLGE